MPYVAASMSSNGAPGMPSHAKKLRTKRLTCRQLKMFAFELKKSGICSPAAFFLFFFGSGAEHDLAMPTVPERCSHSAHLWCRNEALAAMLLNDAFNTTQISSCIWQLADYDAIWFATHLWRRDEALAAVILDGMLDTIVFLCQLMHHDLRSHTLRRSRYVSAAV